MTETNDTILKKYTPGLENMLTVLHELQDNNEENFLTREDIKKTAEYLDVPYTLVHGAASFYSMYSFEPRGKHVIRVCQSPPCHLMGSSTISRELMKLLGVKFGETTPCKTFTLEMTSCLGVCGVAPAIMIGDRVYGNLTETRLKEIIAEKRSEQ